MSRKILLVDRDPDTIALVERHLTLAGLEAVVATEEEAAEALERERPSLVLVDNDLPTVSGAELCRALKTTDAGRVVPVLLLAGEGSSEQRRAGIEECGASEVLGKPLGVAELLAACRRHLGDAGQTSPAPTAVGGSHAAVEESGQDIAAHLDGLFGEEPPRPDQAVLSALDADGSQGSSGPTEAELPEDLRGFAEVAEPAAADATIETAPPRLDIDLPGPHAVPEAVGPEAASDATGPSPVDTDPGPGPSPPADDEQRRIYSEFIAGEPYQSASADAASEAPPDEATQEHDAETDETWDEPAPPAGGRGNTWMIAASVLLLAGTGAALLLVPSSPFALRKQAAGESSGTLLADASSSSSHAADAPSAAAGTSGRDLFGELAEETTTVATSGDGGAAATDPPVLNDAAPQPAEIETHATRAPPSDNRTTKTSPALPRAQRPSASETTTDPTAPRRPPATPEPTRSARETRAPSPPAPETATASEAPAEPVAQPTKPVAVPAQPTAEPAKPVAEPATARTSPPPAEPRAEPPPPRAPSPPPRPAEPTAAEILSRVEPEFPRKAVRRMAGEEVRLSLLINEQGRITRVMVDRSLGEDLDSAAINAVLSWKFRPATENGAPIPSWKTVSFPVVAEP